MAHLFDHLTPTGVFTISRWYAPSNINETGRLMSLAVATLFGEGSQIRANTCSWPRRITLPP
jgi:hypothetical protein